MSAELAGNASDGGEEYDDCLVAVSDWRQVSEGWMEARDAAAGNDAVGQRDTSRRSITTNYPLDETHSERFGNDAIGCRPSSLLSM